MQNINSNFISSQRQPTELQALSITQVKWPCVKALLDTNSTCVKRYIDLLKQKKIEILCTSERKLFALVHALDSYGKIVSTSSPLPVRDCKKEIINKNVDQLKRFFEKAHLIPEKGIDDNYNYVAIHMSGLGGVKPTIPFQPGLALGSIVRGETLVKMEKYATATANNESIIEQINNAEQKLDSLQAKIDSKKSNKVLVEFWKKEKEQVLALIENLKNKLTETTFDEIPIFEGFHQALESPIDMAHSKIQVQPRGFDSLHYSSQYISMKQNSAEIHDKIEQASRASSASIGGGWGIFSANASHDWSKGTADRLAQIKKDDKAEGVLVINAMVTTRHVRSFTELNFDRHKLKMLINAMKSKSPRDLERYGITTRIDKDRKEIKEIYILTEAVLGGSFTALVTFLDEQKMNRKLDKHAEENSNATSVGASGGFWGARVSGGFSTASQNALQTEDDVLNSIINTRVNIEIISQGAMPKFEQDVIEHEIIKYLDLNPSKYELSAKDEADAQKFAKGTAQEKAATVFKRQMKMENAQVAFLNTCRGLASAKDTQKIHTTNSVMEAYDNFAEQMVQDPDCGIPIGFNYQLLDEDRLNEILADLESSSKVKLETNKNASPFDMEIINDNNNKISDGKKERNS
jgi:hypothetical protein